MNAHLAKWPGGAALARTMVAAAVTVAGLAPAVAEEMPRYYYGDHMWGGGWWFLGPLSMLLFLAVAVAVVVVVARWLGGTGAAASTSPTPLDILRERFARGEIDEEEYNKRKRVLGG